MFEILAGIAIGVSLLNMWWLHQSQLKVEALEAAYNKLADIVDTMNERDVNG